MYDLDSAKKTIADASAKSNEEGFVLLQALAKELVTEIERTSLSRTTQLEESSSPFAFQTGKANGTSEEKAETVLRFVTELVNQHQKDETNIGGLMRTFGDDYVKRMTSFAGFFKSKTAE